MSIAHLDGNRFHIFRGGEQAPMLDCSTHLVASDALAALLARFCPNQLEISPARLEQVATGETCRGYSVLRPISELTPDNIGTAPSDGYRVWRAWDRYLFVSPALAEVLREAFPSLLEFSDGFSQFAA